MVELRVSLASSLLKLPHDYGARRRTFVPLRTPTAFRAVYIFLFAFNLGLLGAHNLCWFNQIRLLDAEGAT